MSIRNFKKSIYASHYDKNDSELEQKKKSIEREIQLALKNSDSSRAKKLSEELEALSK